MENTNKISLLIVLFLFIGCNKNEKDLELVVLNKEFYASCLFEDCRNSNIYEAFLDGELPINILEFKITNHSDYTYVFIPTCLECFGGTGFYEFPRASAGLSLRNILINRSLKQTEPMYSQSTRAVGSFEYMTDNLAQNYIKKTQEYYIPFQSMIPIVIQENMIIIPSKSTLYFKTFFSLPHNRTFEQARTETLVLNKNEKHKISLYFNANAEDIKKFMSESMLKTIKENNFKIFDGELISTNEIPLIFK